MKTTSPLLTILGLVLIAAGGLQAQGEPKISYEFTGPSSGNIREADNPNVVLTFRLEEYAGVNAVMYYLYFGNWGSLEYEDIDYWSLWVDENENGLVDGSDYEIGDSHYSGTNPWGVEFYPYDQYGYVLPAGRTAYFIVTATLQSSANPGNYIELHHYDWDSSFYDEWWWYWTYMWEVNWNGEGYGPTMTIIPNTANLALNGGLQVPTSNAAQGSLGHSILQFKLTHDSTGDDPTITAIRIRPDTGNTAQSTDVISVRLYRELGTPNGIVDGAEGNNPHVGAHVGSFNYTFSGLNFSIPPGSGGITFLVVADINGEATTGRVIVMSVQRSDISTLSQWSGGVNKFTENPQSIVKPLAEFLHIVDQPVDTAAGAVINGPAGIRVDAMIDDDTQDTAFASMVIAQIASGPGAFMSGSTIAVVASNGRATFSNLRITVAGYYTIRFVSLPLTAATSDGFPITPLAATRLQMIEAPQDGVVGQNLPPPPVVHALDTYGNIATSFNGTVTAELSSNPGGSTLTGHQVSAQFGIVIFAALQLNKVASGYTMRFTATGLTASAVSNPFSMSVGAAAKLHVLSQPGHTTGGVAIVPWPRVQVRDVGDNPVYSYVGSMSAAIGNNPSGGTLSGPTTVGVGDAVSEFPNLTIDLAGAGYTLVFSIEGGSITVESSPFGVAVGQPAKLGLAQQPSDGFGGTPFSTQPLVQVQDAGGNPVATDSSSTVTVTITTSTGMPGATLLGNSTLTLVAGVAAFSDLAIDRAGPQTYTLTFTSSTYYTTVTSVAFTISVGAPARLGVLTQPGLATFAAPFVQQPVVQVQDAGGNHVDTSTAFVTAVLDPMTGATGAVLQGMATVQAAGGLATFGNLTINLPGVGFVIRFTSPGLSSVDSAAFNVASAGTQLGVSLQPGYGSISTPLTIQPVVEIRDENGTVVSLDNYTLVSVAIVPSTGAPGATLEGTTVATAVNGSATFTDLRIPTSGVGYRLRFTCYPSLTPVISDAFDVAGQPFKLVLTRQPSGSHAGEPLQVQPRLEVRDINDILCVGDNETVINAYITPASGAPHAILTGTNPVTVVAGVAEFADLAIDRPGQNFSLSFSATPSLHPTFSLPFTVIGEQPSSNVVNNGYAAGTDGGSCTGRGTNAASWLVLIVLMAFVAVRRSFKRS